jgi:hypothetical protein
MIFKILPAVEGEPQMFARIDDDDLSRMNCTAEYPEFIEYIKSGAELQDADGNVMTQEEADNFINELP